MGGMFLFARNEGLKSDFSIFYFKKIMILSAVITAIKFLKFLNLLAVTTAAKY